VSSHESPIRVNLRGEALLNSSRLNKGTAFTEQERLDFGLEGLLPHQVSSIEQQVAMVLENFRRQGTPIDKYIYLRALQDRNETLFFAALTQNLGEMMPIVYTPTVAQAVEEFSHIFRSSRGLYLTPEDVDRMDLVLRNADIGRAAVIVCTDNEGILGIGDQGTGGMAIPIGKLALYAAVGGFRPEQCLPICLDVGTDNPALLNDPMYLGVRSPRLRGTEYERFIDAFVSGIRRCAPRAVLQWEDFSRDKAFDNLERHRDQLPSFNDDIQGTTAVAVAALMGAAKLAGRDFTSEVICILGAGGAGVGVAGGVRVALEAAGLSPEEAARRVLVFDSRGLLVDDRKDLLEYKRAVAAPASLVSSWTDRSLHGVIERVRPTALVGLSGTPGAIDEEAARLMAQEGRRPAIFPMSNPTSKAEAVPADLLEWTDGRAIIATGSPFDPVTRDGVSHRFSQANNVYIFPGLGLGAYVSQARVISAGMIVAAARRLHELTEPSDYAQGLVLPPVEDLRAIAAEVGAATIEVAIQEGVAGSDEALTAADLREWMYVPAYSLYVPA